MNNNLNFDIIKYKTTIGAYLGRAVRTSEEIPIKFNRIEKIPAGFANSWRMNSDPYPTARRPLHYLFLC